MGMRNPSPSHVCRRLFDSYSRFLFLCKTRPELDHKLAPPVSIDLLWHAHQSTPQLYEAETVRVLGYRLDHDPWPVSDKLRKVDDDFVCAWKSAFGTDLARDHLFQDQ